MSFLDCCGCRGTTKTAMQTRTQVQQERSQGGIGVIFRMDNNGALVVDTLVQGGPAWESSSNGGLQVDDVLKTVDEKDVYRWPIVHLVPLLVGPEGSIVRLGVERSEYDDPTNTKSLIIEVRRKHFITPRTLPMEDTGSPIIDARRGLYSRGTIQNQQQTVYNQPDHRRNISSNPRKDSSFI